MSLKVFKSDIATYVFKIKVKKKCNQLYIIRCPELYTVHRLIVGGEGEDEKLSCEEQG